jgi:hypothetical protein
MTSENELGIHELDLNTIHPLSVSDTKQGAKYIAIGTSGSGKSSVVKALIYSKKDITPVGHIFSGTEDSNGFFGEFFPSTFIFRADDLQSFIDLKTKDPMAYQQNPVVRFKERQKIAVQYLEPKEQNPWALEVWDDCTADTKFLKRPIVSDIYKNGRHWRMLHISTYQYCMDLPTNVRENINGVFILNGGNAKTVEKIYNNYVEASIDKAEFNDALATIAQDYTALYINKKSKSGKIDDSLLYYRADLEKIPPSWKFGCKSFWDFHYARGMMGPQDNFSVGG